MPEKLTGSNTKGREHPSPDQVEITLLGPGKGECCLVHLGDGKWVIIDSCIDSRTKNPAALDYLASIGVDPSTSVSLIIETHWHDDHIAGMSRVVEACKSAKFCTSASLSKPEFLAIVNAYDTPLPAAAGPGAREIKEVFETLSNEKSRPNPLYAIEGRIILQLENWTHQRQVSIATLSPSDAQIEKFMTEITALMPSVKTTRRRLVPQSPNHIAIVTWISFGETSILLGADLEETGDLNTGWSAIVRSSIRPGSGQARTFKIPHHGSENAHSDEVWDKLVIKEPFAILTPYNRGRTKRPSPTDAERIISLTPNAYITAPTEGRRSPRRSPMVERTIRETVGRLRLSESDTGCIRLRNLGKDSFDEWHIDLFRGAMPLAKLYPAND